jgi:hypothetical protein
MNMKPALPTPELVDSLNPAPQHECDAIADRIKESYLRSAALIPLKCINDTLPELFTPDEWVTQGNVYWLAAVLKARGFGNISDELTRQEAEKAEANGTAGITEQGVAAKPPLAIMVIDAETNKLVVPSEKYRALSESRFRMFSMTPHPEIYIN